MKYPRTPHLPWSLGGTADDVRLINIDCLKEKTLVYTEKLDGENTVMTRDSIHARSETGYNNPWQTVMKKKWSEIRYNIPNDFTICGENLYAIHSIEYNNLKDYFYVFGMLNKDIFLSWDETKEYCQLLELELVPEIIKGELVELPIPKTSVLGNECEGYVVRNIESFHINMFSNNVAKAVREHHVQTNIHWTKNWRAAVCQKQKI